MFVIVPMVIVIIKALSRLDDAAQDQAHQSHQEAAFSDSFCIYHGRSYAVCRFRLTYDIHTHSRLIYDNAREHYSYKGKFDLCGHSHITAAPPPLRLSTRSLAPMPAARWRMPSIPCPANTSPD
jgi:hypothetical protein